MAKGDDEIIIRGMSLNGTSSSRLDELVEAENDLGDTREEVARNKLIRDLNEEPVDPGRHAAEDLRPN